jgi:hypothetical protein
MAKQINESQLARKLKEKEELYRYLGDLQIQRKHLNSEIDRGVERLRTLITETEILQKHEDLRAKGEDFY